METKKKVFVLRFMTVMESLYKYMGRMEIPKICELAIGLQRIWWNPFSGRFWLLLKRRRCILHSVSSNEVWKEEEEAELPGRGWWKAASKKSWNFATFWSLILPDQWGIDQIDQAYSLCIFFLGPDLWEGEMEKPKWKSIYLVLKLCLCLEILRNCLVLS